MNGVAQDGYYPGLEGVISSQTAISNIVERDGAGVLEYRGYRIEDLASRVGYEEAAFLLLHGDLPTRLQLGDFNERLRAARDLPGPLIRVLGELPGSASPMDVLRTSVSLLAHDDPDRDAAATDHAANVRKAERLIARMATAIAYRERLASGLAPIPPDDRLGHAANFLRMVTGEVPSEAMRRAFDGSLVLYAEHELNASTFAARVTVSTLSDLHSGIVAAVGTLKGTLHGGANEEAWKLLEAVGSPGRAEAWVAGALARHERLMGFGHRVYKKSDPRAVILKEYCREIAAEKGDDRWERIAEPIEVAVGRKGLPPNVDWPSARLYHYLGIPLRLYTPIFAMARVAGWAAHAIEQIDHNRLLRPRGRYIGPTHRGVSEIDRR
ncbi:Citrate synthase 2 [Aquisphaera giovannonii]|uniref:Citrate synthase n=1 Tax=Aquisphaera giovannonii TaxID=406548 RepID=A0A5B9W1A8_9BACT|nr:citrate/2-methylcitrate synthase [Aquisphaera giovannonii]QEH34343.1 Citrate synthase 2 [Aquisphaera giovannonii]